MAELSPEPRGLWLAPCSYRRTPPPLCAPKGFRVHGDTIQLQPGELLDARWVPKKCKLPTTGFRFKALCNCPVSPPFLLSSQSIRRGLLPTPGVHSPTAFLPACMVCSTVPILFPASSFPSSCILETSPTQQLWLAESQNVGAGRGGSAPLPTFLRSGNWKPETG